MSQASEVRALRIRIGQLRAKVRKEERGSPAQIKLMQDVQKLETTLYRVQSN